MIAIRKKPKNPENFFLGFVNHNSRIFNFVIIFLCSLGGRANICVHGSEKVTIFVRCSIAHPLKDPLLPIKTSEGIMFHKYI